METTVNRQQISAHVWPPTIWTALLMCLTILTLCVHGYHPLAEDGGLYVAGIEYRLDRTLFPHYSEFVRAHLRYSIFAPLVAGTVRITHVPLPWVLFSGNLASIAMTLFAARQILRRVFPGNDPAQLAGVALLAAWWTLPVAGTSLMLMDPYVTARSFSMPLSLLAVAFALDEWTRAESSGAVNTFACVLLAAAMHPLMAGYAACFIFVLRFLRRKNTTVAWARSTVGLLMLSVTVAGLLQWAAPVESPPARVADITRYYWFLSQWHWYELLGIIAPLAIFAVLLRSGRRTLTSPFASLCRTCITCGVIAGSVAIAFARESLSTHMVARLQVLRIYLIIYGVMAILLGAYAARWAAQTAIHHRVRYWSLSLVIAGAAVVMYFVQWQTFTDSPHIETPWHASSNDNAWVQAFLWAKLNTPKDALFALDARYINQKGEDAQTFRATSLRSALPDYSKDGGEAAITPSLASTWMDAASAQRQLSALNDSERDAKLRPFGVTWMVLRADALTAHICPYNNSVVKVCPLPR